MSLSSLRLRRWTVIGLDERESGSRLSCEGPIRRVKQRREEWGIRYSEGLVGFGDRNSLLVDRCGCPLLLRVARVPERSSIFVFLVEDAREVIIASSVVEDEF